MHRLVARAVLPCRAEGGLSSVRASPRARALPIGEAEVKLTIYDYTSLDDTSNRV